MKPIDSLLECFLSMNLTCQLLLSKSDVSLEVQKIFKNQNILLLNEVTWRTERAPRPSTSRTQRARRSRSWRTEPITIQH